MDCKTARLLLDFHRPHPAELLADDHDALEAHLARCPDCAAAARADRQLDAALGPAIGAVAVPDGLRDRILARLGQERGDRQQRWLGWAVRLSAAAAVLALLTWLGWAWLRPTPQTRDLDTFELRHRLALQYPPHGAPDREQVEQWFQDERGVDMVAPEDFNYALLAYYDLTECQGKQVPMLLFLNGSQRAHVYVIGEKQFNVPSLLAQPKQDSGGYTVVVQPAARGDMAYVIVYTGDSLQAFRQGGVGRPAF